MPVRLSDPALARLYQTFEANHASNPGVQLGRAEVLQLLAQAGAGLFTSKEKLLEQLSAPGMGPEAQVALLKKGLSGKERGDLAKVLEAGTVPLSADARALLGKVVETWGSGPRPAGAADGLDPARPAPRGPNLSGGAPVDLPDPALHPDEHGPNGEALYGKHRFQGELWGVQGPSLEGVRQGYLSDCYFVAGLASVLNTQSGKQHVAGMVKDNGDGTYAVTFKERDRKMKFQDVTVQVDAELYVHPSGEALYGKTGEGNNTSGDMKLFFPIIEKAYAQWKGGYEAITEDTAANLYEAVLGRSATHQPITQKGERHVWETIGLALSQDRPITAGTRGEGKELQVQDASGKPLSIYPEHQYSVFGCKEEGGRKLVTLRNPWGKVDRGDGGATGGVFTLDLATFKKCFASLSFVDPPRP